VVVGVTCTYAFVVNCGELRTRGDERFSSGFMKREGDDKATSQDKGRTGYDRTGEGIIRLLLVVY